MHPDLFFSLLLMGSFLAGGGIFWGLSYLKFQKTLSKSQQTLESQLASALGQLSPLKEHLKETQEERTRLQQELRILEGAKASALTKLEDMQALVSEREALFHETKETLSDTFRSLAAQALATNNQGFLILAQEKFRALQTETSAHLDHRHALWESLLQPLTESLQTYHKATQELEHQRLREISAVSEQLRHLASAQVALQTETSKLANALRSPQIRGRWGEIALRKTAELAGMSAHCDFFEQTSVTGETSRLRPDMIVKLPAGREVVVDSKVPLNAFLDSLEASTDLGRETALNRHVKQVKHHILQLAAKEYWEQFPSAPEFVVLFIPNDSFLAAAAERDPSLMERALTKKVVLATPTTFIALLRAIAYGWRQGKLTEEAERIAALGQELFDRMGTFAEHVARMGQSLGRSVESYNAAIASLETRIFPTARKFQQLGVSVKKEIADPQHLDQTPRSLHLSDEKDDSP
ncbi:MAG: DNA recombination protein RmuC [Nitrospirales bacterium]|nr:DNA recombination protein RmuC [Nitrospirales bacterium]